MESLELDAPDVCVLGGAGIFQHLFRQGFCAGVLLPLTIDTGYRPAPEVGNRPRASLGRRMLNV